MNKINLKTKLASFSDYWNPRIIAELNGQSVKVAKFKGEFVWHQHEHEDELFLVIEGEFTMQFRDRDVLLTKGECIVVPRGVEHRPVAKNEVEIMLFEPSTIVNTGNTESELTQQNIQKI